MLVEKTVTSLLDAFSSAEPTPGGGSASALAGAVGAALLAMVAGLPKTKSGIPEERATLDAARVELLQLERALADLIDRDADAYDLVVAAYRRPKATDADKAARSQAIQDAMRVATEVPAETVRLAARGMALAKVVADAGNPSATSDIAVGVHLMMTASQGAMLNVGANIGSLKDAAVAARIASEVRDAVKAPAVAFRDIFRGGLADLMRQTYERLGLPPHGAAPDISPDMLAAPATQLLARIGTPEARQALEVLARGTNARMRDAAASALSMLPGA